MVANDPRDFPIHSGVPIVASALVAANTGGAQLPGSEEGTQQFAAGFDILRQGGPNRMSIRNAFIQCITGIEMALDPTLSVEGSHAAIGRVSQSAKRAMDRQTALHGRDLGDEARIFVDAVGQNMSDIVACFHARSAVAAAVAEMARNTGFIADGIDPKPSAASPIHLRLSLEGKIFILEVDTAGIRPVQNLQPKPHMLPLPQTEWLERVINDHRAAHPDHPDKQVALIRYALVLKPDDQALVRQLAEQLEEAGRRDAAQVVARTARNRLEGHL